MMLTKFRLGTFLVRCVAIAAIFVWVPRIAAACAVCMAGREDENRIAFELMTAFMTIMPFLLIAGVFWWLRGRLRDLEARHEEARKTGASANSRMPKLARTE
jgi:hypothetical protein